MEGWGRAGDGREWRDGEKKKREVMSPSPFSFAPFFFLRKERETRNSVLSIVLTRLAEWCDDAKIGEDLL